MKDVLFWACVFDSPAPSSSEGFLSFTAASAQCLCCGS